MVVYLAKSNRANPDTVMALRKELEKHSIEYLEFSGGAYSNDDLLKANLLLIVPEKLAETYAKVDGKPVDYKKMSFSSVIGKGLAQQIQNFAYYKNKNNIYFYLGDRDLNYIDIHTGKITLKTKELSVGQYDKWTVIDIDDYVHHANAKIKGPESLKDVIRKNGGTIVEATKSKVNKESTSHSVIIL